MKNLQKGFIIPVLITIVAVLAIGGVYVWQKTKSPQSMNTEVSGDTQNQIEQNTFHVTRTPPSNKPTSQTKVNSGPMTVEQIEQEKIQENLIANQNKQPVDMVSKPCTNNIKSEESSSSEYSSLVLTGWTFRNAVISDFDCDGNKDVIVASYASFSDGKQQFFKINIQFYQKVNNSWKLINQNDAIGGELFDMHPAKTNEGANAVAFTFKPSGIKRIVWIRNGYPTGM